jgi:hemoglobin
MMRVLQDKLLEPIFKHMPHEHRIHVAHFLVEVLKGPKLYTDKFGSDALRRMVGKHLGKRIKEEQRKRWVELLLESADEIKMPDDPEFRTPKDGPFERTCIIGVRDSKRPRMLQGHHV